MPEMFEQQLMRDADKFMQRATSSDLSRAAAHFRQLARQATSPQEREFYADRAYQFSLRAVQV